MQPLTRGSLSSLKNSGNLTADILRGSAQFITRHRLFSFLFRQEARGNELRCNFKARLQTFCFDPLAACVLTGADAKTDCRGRNAVCKRDVAVCGAGIYARARTEMVFHRVCALCLKVRSDAGRDFLCCRKAASPSSSVVTSTPSALNSSSIFSKYALASIRHA